MAGSVVYQVARARPGGPWATDEAQEWIARARSSLALARSTGQGVRVEDLCMLARQAVERAVRAVLTIESVPVPPEESARAMLAALEGAGVPVPERLGRAATLFPGEESADRVRIEKYYEAILVATEAIRYAEERLRA